MKLLSKKLVCEKLSIARATLDRYRSNPTLQFPKGIPIGNGTWKKVYWLESEIDAWMEAQAARERS